MANRLGRSLALPQTPRWGEALAEPFAGRHSKSRIFKTRFERQESASPRPGCDVSKSFFFAVDSRTLALTSLLIVPGAGRGSS